MLAENGLRYNNSHVTPVCSPTRAALLTGRNPNDVGMATVADFDMGPETPNKRGRIKPKACTIAENRRKRGSIQVRPLSFFL